MVKSPLFYGRNLFSVMIKIISVTPNELESLIEEVLRRILSEKIKKENDSFSEIMNVDQASKFLNVAKQTLYVYTSKNIIPFIKRYKKLYFKKSDLENWLMEGRQKTNYEIEQESL